MSPADDHKLPDEIAHINKLHSEHHDIREYEVPVLHD